MKVFKPVREQPRWGSAWKAASPTPVLPELVRRAWSLLLNAIARLGAVCTSEGLDLQSSSPPVCWGFFSACLSFSCLHSVAFVPCRLHTRCSFFLFFFVLATFPCDVPIAGISWNFTFLRLVKEGPPVCAGLFQCKCQQPTADLYLAADNASRIHPDD